MKVAFSRGQHVRIRGLPYSGRTGVLLDPGRRLGRPGWNVLLDAHSGRPKKGIYVWESALAPSTEFQSSLCAGQRVILTCRMLEGHTGVLIRPAHLLWKRAWLVELDDRPGGIARTRVAERALMPKV